LGRDTDQDFTVIDPDQHDFLAGAHRQRFQGLQTLRVFAQQALAILQLAQRPQQCQQQANDENEAEQVLQPVAQSPNRVHAC
jgi:hypothetical protein